ncbi:MAG: RnfABCDGE type electron transport complex subunit D [Chloroflexia bacterium]|nr:RnfABCDGE type electron transport complex subunit D [Chloroflexia bacterium]
MSKLLTVAHSPHNYGKDTIKSLMYGVIIALIPTLAVSIYFFGLGALIVTLTAVASAMIFEYLISKFLLKKEPTLKDGSAIITGLLLAFNVPSNLPIGIIIIGALVAIGIGKMTFGGLGNNPFNPALVGRVFLLVSFPVQMTSWPVPIASRMSYLDAMTGATPLGVMKEGLKNGEQISTLMEQIPSHMQLFIGNMGGSLGEVAGLALILGFVYMLIKKVITWHIPVSIIGTIAIFTGILWLIDPTKNADPLFHLLTGGVLLGSIFMATDYVSSPMGAKGQIIFGVGIGILTVLIRVAGAYPEGVSFAILIMNAFVPLINMYFKPKRFGEVVKNG